MAPVQGAQRLQAGVEVLVGAAPPDGQGQLSRGPLGRGHEDVPGLLAPGPGLHPYAQVGDVRPGRGPAPGVDAAGVGADLGGGGAQRGETEAEEERAGTGQRRRTAQGV